MKQTDYMIDGFYFVNENEFKRAQKEKATIEKLKASGDFDSVEKMNEMYRKMVSKRYFVTPVGLAFLSQLRTHLEENIPEFDAPYITVAPTGKEAYKEKISELKREISEKNDQIEKDINLRNKLVVAVVALAICVICMIFMVVTSDNSGLVNAEQKVLDKYSAWEEDLKSREALIREKEDALKNINITVTEQQTSESND